MFPVVCHKTMAMAQNELKITNGTMRLFRLNAFFFIGFILSFFIFITLFMSQIKPVADIVLAPESQPQQILTKVWEIFHFSQYITWSLLYGFVNIRLNCNLNKIVKRSRMAKQNSDFFQELEHVKIPWGERSIWVPLFYYDSMKLDALFLAPREKLKALLPSARMHPYRITSKYGIVSISAMEFRETDIGPYNEVAISIPFTLDKATPMFTGTLRKSPEEPYLYIHQLPVTTEIARDAGVEFAGYPKFLAIIEFEKKEDRVTCKLAEGNQHILTFAGRKLPIHYAPRSRVNFFSTRGGRILRSHTIASERQLARSKDASHAQIELGDHPIAQELKELGLGKMLVYQYAPQYQSILSPALESFAI